MSLVIRNLQRTVNINTSLLHLDTNLLRKVSGFLAYDLGIMIVTDEEIAHLNRGYRGVNEVTDVLAFPYHEIDSRYAGEIPEIESEDDKMLGDIVLAPAYIQQEAKKHGNEFHSTMMTMITHGICHLVGYDHETSQQWIDMYNKELDILTKFNKLTGYQCAPLLGVGHYLNT